MGDYKVIVVYTAPSGRPGRRTTWKSTLQTLVDRYGARGCTEFRWRRARDGAPWKSISPSG